MDCLDLNFDKLLTA